MKSAMNKVLAMSAIASLMMGGDPFGSKREEQKLENFSGELKEVVPAGCEKYYFNINGGYCNQWNQHTVFECIAMNVKSARKKFEKYKAKL